MNKTLFLNTIKKLASEARCYVFISQRPVVNVKCLEFADKILIFNVYSGSFYNKEKLEPVLFFQYIFCGFIA